jgi:hypothetical protein
MRIIQIAARGSPLAFACCLTLIAVAGRAAAADALDPVRLTRQELSGEIGRRIEDLVYKNYMVLDLAMPWRFVRGRKMQDGKVALLRGPVVYCIGTAANATLLEKNKDPGELTIDPRSLMAPVPDRSVRPDGLKVAAKAWPPGSDGKGAAPLDVTLTEFVDPSGLAVYFRIPDPSAAADDELLEK